MTQEQHPITPSIELIYQWVKEVCPEPGKGVHLIEEHVVTQAARWGADMELDACCSWVEVYAECGGSLRAARRPKPPSLKEQALCHLESFAGSIETLGMDSDLIRRALEALPD